MTTNRDDSSPAAMTLALRITAVLGMGLTALTEASHHFPALMELCGGSGSGCADVAASRYASLLGVPVTVWGFLSYALLLGLLQWWRPGVLLLASWLMGAELYFLWVMATILHTFCTFCLIQFALVTFLFAATLWWARNRTDFVLPGKVWGGVGVLAFAFALLAIPARFGGPASTFGGGETPTAIGPADAPLTVEIYSDYECGHCKKHDPEVDRLMAEHPEVRFVFRDFVIRGHKLSPVAASYAAAVAFQNGPEAYVKARTELFAHQERLYDYLQEHLPTVEFTGDLKGRINAKVAADMKRAEELGVYSTPTTVVYQDGRMVQIFRGATPSAKIAEFLK